MEVEWVWNCMKLHKCTGNHFEWCEIGTNKYFEVLWKSAKISMGCRAAPASVSMLKKKTTKRTGIAVPFL